MTNLLTQASIFFRSSCLLIKQAPEEKKTAGCLFSTNSMKHLVRTKWKNWENKLSVTISDRFKCTYLLQGDRVVFGAKELRACGGGVGGHKDQSFIEVEPVTLDKSDKIEKEAATYLLSTPISASIAFS